MKNIDIKDLGQWVGKTIIFNYGGTEYKVTIMISMGPTYFLIHDKEMKFFVLEGKCYNNKSGSIIYRPSFYEA